MSWGKCCRNLVIGDNTIVNNQKLVSSTRTLRMTIFRCRLPVCGPPSVWYSSMNRKWFFEIQISSSNIWASELIVSITKWYSITGKLSVNVKADANKKHLRKFKYTLMSEEENFLLGIGYTHNHKWSVF